MTPKPLSPRELRIWYAFRMMGEDVLARVDRDIALASGISGPDFAVLSRLAAFGQGQMRQQELGRSLGWDKSRLSHHLTRMQERALIERQPGAATGNGQGVLVVLTQAGREKLDAARPAHADSIRRHLLSRLTADQIDTIIRISNLLGDED
ncbi:MAG TPA: MarR family transcriptional regulator [Acidobacteriaceae bacterium]|nr:MarR family transcriptional regulator [Acidobacteriaceae bacterium]